MTGPVAMAAMAMVMLAQPAKAAPVATGDCVPVASQIVLSPPIGHPMRLVVTTTRPARDGTMRTFGLEYQLMFEASGRGLLLTATLVRLNTGKSGGLPDAMQSIMGPLVGRPVTYLVSSDGQTLLLQNGDQLWASIARDLSAAATRAEAEAGAAADNLLARLSPNQRDAMLAADVRQLLRFAGRDWTQVYEEDRSTRAACGQIALIEKASPTATGTLLMTRQRWLVDSGWGMVTQHDEEQLLRRGPGSNPETAAQTRRTLMLIGVPGGAAVE